MDGFLRRPESAVEQAEAVRKFIRSWWPVVRWWVGTSAAVGSVWWFSVQTTSAARGEYDSFKNTLEAHGEHLARIDTTEDRIARAVEEAVKALSRIQGFIDAQGQRRGSVQPMPETLELPG